ncbi:hypothetical protein ACOMHN_002637 [Nucella lapillus]
MALQNSLGVKIEIDIAEDTFLYWTAKDDAAQGLRKVPTSKPDPPEDGSRSTDSSVRVELGDRQTPVSQGKIAKRIDDQSMKEMKVTGEPTPVTVKMEVSEEHTDARSSSTRPGGPWPLHVKTEPEENWDCLIGAKQRSVKSDPETHFSGKAVVEHGHVKPELHSSAADDVKEDSHLPVIQLKKEMKDFAWDPASSNSNGSFPSVDSDTKSDLAVDFKVHFENYIKRENDECICTPVTMFDSTSHGWEVKQDIKCENY